jgi:4-aminobutyrate aminotransferase-like enzyme
MPDTIQKYKDYVMTGFLKSVAPIVIDKASGATVTDIHGREYLDCFAGISVVNAGHGNPQVIAAAKAQMDKLVHCSSYLYHVQPVADLAEKIAHIVPRGLTKTFFGNGGAEAIEGAMKLARLYSGKHEFISLHGSFHGRSWGALSVTGNYAKRRAAPTPREFLLLRLPTYTALYGQTIRKPSAATVRKRSTKSCASPLPTTSPRSSPNRSWAKGASSSRR